MKIVLNHTFEELVSINNLLLVWQEFLNGKKKKKDAQEFQLHLMDNILSLHKDLIDGIYRHGGYQEFSINDPKPRIIHKATVRDRLLHHAVYRILYPFFDRTFTADSFSCQNGKGTHKAMRRFRSFGYIVSKNSTRTCWVLKCDIKKFFHSIDQQILLEILKQYIPDNDIINLLQEIISSFCALSAKTGLPLGNLTSQLFSNVYLNEFDQFVKHRLKIEYYIRYADDFVILSEDKNYLEQHIPFMQDFLKVRLSLTLHPDKVFIKTLSSGIDFLGWVHFLNHSTLRTTTRKRMFRKLLGNPKSASLNSYLGLISHGNSYMIYKKINHIFVTRSEKEN